MACCRNREAGAALDTLAGVNLAERACARVDALSGGQQQRVSIARALVRRPRLLIADEPAASLNLVSDHDVMSLFTSHDMAHVRDYADRIIAVKAGRNLFDKPPITTTAADLEETFRVEPR